MRNQCYLGLSFGMSHGIHLAAILALATTDSTTFWTLASAVSIIVGGLGYVAIALLVATSFDRVTRWFGTDRWRAVVGAGTWFVPLGWSPQCDRKSSNARQVGSVVLPFL
ncbi:hypothetical protein [Nocardia sp. SSK8]|uniref:hypothetical protein n=1 Tax=Nocardia sp. SSK8 TaxID=3120154 RepID=UPI00300A8D3E